MKLLARIVATSLTIGLIGCATQEKPAGTPAPAPGKPVAAKTRATTTKQAAKPTVPKAPRFNEFEQMITVLNLQGEQLATFQARCVAREKAIQEWETSADGQKLTALRTAQATAKQAKDEAKLKELQPQLERLSKKAGDLRVTQRATVMSTLTLPQQQKWAGYALANSVTGKSMGKVKLSDDQLKQVQTICDKAAAGFVKADTIAKDPYLSGLQEIQPAVRQQIISTVLTSAQRETLQSKPQAPTAPSK